MPTQAQDSLGEVAVDAWPALPLDDWRKTYATLHMWTQVVGKVRLALTPLVNHWWNVPLYVTSRGLGTGAMPCDRRDLEILFDLVDHNLVVTTSDGQRKALPLIPRSVADFYQEVMASLRSMGVDVRIWPKPVEVSDPIPFAEDRTHCDYDPEPVTRLFRILLQTAQVFYQFRGGFLGKCSPVHFFWGSFDLAVTRFSGRRAPERPGTDRITREAYSHECISHGFWPGGSWFGNEVSSPIYYSYTAPEPPGLRDEPVRPAAARFDATLGEFVLPYDDVRRAPSPCDCLLEFLQSTYEAGANRAGWNRAELERVPLA
ncbi:MAG TPA: DUF5996 family protein [Tepidisphaeraceae bacterium]|jgi:hypothetical protein